MDNEAERLKYLAHVQERGHIVVGDDGYNVFWPSGQHGFCNPCELRWIADELDRLNGPWDNVVHNDPSIVEDQRK